MWRFIKITVASTIHSTKQQPLTHSITQLNQQHYHTLDRLITFQIPAVNSVHIVNLLYELSQPMKLCTSLTPTRTRWIEETESREEWRWVRTKTLLSDRLHARSHHTGSLRRQIIACWKALTILHSLHFSGHTLEHRQKSYEPLNIQNDVTFSYKLQIEQKKYCWKALNKTLNFCIGHSFE